MAVVLVDTCVLTDLMNPLSEWFEWSVSTLENLDVEHAFAVNAVIYAECSVGFDRIEEVEALFHQLQFDVRQIPREALFLAGKAFVNYRKNRGTITGVLPDFFIGAHAAIENFRLMTRDERRFSTYFPTVNLITPST